MNLLLSILVEDLFPIFAVAGIGFLLARRLAVDVRPLSSVTFYVLAPCLLFNLLVSSTLGAGDVARMVLFAAGLRLAMGLIAWVAAIPLGLDKAALSALLLVAMFSNSGNYGLSVVLFAFGQEALTHASLYFATNALLMYTLGVFIASAGRGGTKTALVGVFKVPAVYGAVAAGIVMAAGVRLPLAITRPVALLADAAIPAMLLVLGMQLERGRWPGRPAVVGLASFLALVVSPLVGFGLADLFGLSGVARQAGVTQAAMPAAVVNTILAIEYDVQPSLVTAVVFVSTLLSPLTVAVVIALLQAG